MTEQELRAEIIDHLKLIDPALGTKGAKHLADKWLRCAKEVYGKSAKDNKPVYVNLETSQLMDITGKPITEEQQ